MAVNKILDKQELLNHIHTHPHDKSAIPYVTSYYSEDWSFCMSQEDVDNLPDGEYRVFIDSEFKDGNLAYKKPSLKEHLRKKYFFHLIYAIHQWQTTNSVDPLYSVK